MKFTIKLVTVALSLWFSATASAFAFNRPNGRILDSSGDVVVLRGDRNIRATLGMAIYPSDRLQVNEGGQLLVSCSTSTTQTLGGISYSRLVLLTNLTQAVESGFIVGSLPALIAPFTDLEIQAVESGVSPSNPCATIGVRGARCTPGLVGCPHSPDLVLTVEEAKCNPDLTGCPDRGTILAWGDTSIPFSVSPRRTTILDPQPILRWNPVAGATSYLVTVTGSMEDGREMEWSVETTDDRITYIPQTEAQVLQSGWDYFLTVEADTGTASFDEPVQLGGMGFQLLDESKKQELRSRSVALAVSRQYSLMQEAISEEAKTLATARLYLKYDLISEAILLLEKVLETGQETAALHLLIGELYQDRLLVAPPATKHYERAIALVDEANLEEKALAYEGLGRVRAAMQNYTEAVELLTQARGIYEMLGDREQVEALDKTIQELMTE